jgi:hypothetical protein
VTAYEWQRQLDIGAEGVRQVVSYLKAQGYHVEDVTEDPDYQEQDIDLRVRSPRQRKWRTVEVKHDTYKSGNIFLELVTSRGKPGCVFKSRAMTWAYLLPRLGILLWIDLPALQLWVCANATDYEPKKVTSKRGGAVWTITGIAVPWQELVSDGVAVSVPLTVKGDTNEKALERDAA